MTGHDQPSACVVLGCKKPAEYDCWGPYFKHRGPCCWQHTLDQAGCLCARCVQQTAVTPIPKVAE
jgi:hypothetical protein